MTSITQSQAARYDVTEGVRTGCGCMARLVSRVVLLDSSRRVMALNRSKALVQDHRSPHQEAWTVCARMRETRTIRTVSTQAQTVLPRGRHEHTNTFKARHHGPHFASGARLQFIGGTPET